MLFIGQDILMPLIYAIIIAVVVSPLVDFLQHSKINRAVSVVSVMLLSLLILGGIIALLSSQLNKFSEAIPVLETKGIEVLDQVVLWISSSFNISIYNINAWIADTKSNILNNSNSFLGNTLVSAGGIMSTLFLTPVYTFMILLYQPHLVKFVHKLFGGDNNLRVNEMLSKIKNIIQSYLVGLFFEFVIVAILNTIGLLLLDIEYALLLGIFAALLNIIPYLGGLIGIFLFMAIALLTKTPIDVVYVVILYGLIQFIDNNFIVPKIVGSKVKLNALISLIAVILGAALWGIPGMFLSIPFIAILKVILDCFDSLKPWGFLLGEIVQEPNPVRIEIIIKKHKKSDV
jgi:predicted PurR-regulated permease PerM